MRYFFVLLLMFLMILIMLFHNDGYANFKYFKYGSIDFDSSEKLNSKLSLRLLWSDKIGCGECSYCVNLNPEYEGSYVFVVDYYGVVKKLMIDTGACIWSKRLLNIFCNTCCRHSIATLVSGGLSVNNHFLYVGSELAKVYALDANTGAIFWVSEVSGEVISKPVISHGLVLVYTSNGVLQGLDARNGVIKWSMSFEIPDFSFRMTLLPVISDNVVIIGDPGGVISACYIDTGELIWQKKISNLSGMTDVDRLSNITSIIVTDNVVYGVAYNGNIVALDLFSGDLIWSRSIGSLINIIVEGDCIYVIDQNNRVLALKRGDGNILWSKSDFIYHRLTSMVSYKDYILFGDTKGYLYSLFKKDGSFFGRKRISVGSFNHLAIVHNKIVCYEKNGTLSVWSLTSNDA